MPINPRELDQVLTTPENKDVTAAVLVTAVILEDPANAADLVPALTRYDTLRARNARKILCMFGGDAVPPFLNALILQTDPDARQAGIEVMWTMLVGESAVRVRDILRAVDAPLGQLLEDKQPLPDRDPPLTERDFHGRLCDFAYIVVRLASDRRFDQSGFRALDDTGRDREIRTWRQRGLVA